MSTSFNNGEKMCLSQRISKKNSNNKENKGKLQFNVSKIIEDQKYLLRQMMNDMKKKLDFIDKTNWMFTQDNFDIHFLDK